MIKRNIAAHNAIAEKYESLHGEIFNDVEQARLRSKLAEAAGLIKAGNAELRALDLGCGSGNLTVHLLELGFHVTAADVSEKFLDSIKRRFSGAGRLETARLNGRDLSVFEDGRFNFTAAYSVLHHVPDYLAMTREMARVTGRGGVVFIDHELSPDYWEQEPEYAAFLKDSRRHEDAMPESSRFFRVSTYIRKVKQLLNPRYISEGDIHVWPDDHLDWPEMEKILAETGFEVMIEDYLLFRRGCPQEVYSRYEKLCNDERLLVASRSWINRGNI